MIVRNEAPIIRRCIESAAPLIDFALIVDTGSTDDTIREIQSVLAERQIAGFVLQEPWRDFAYNRSFALAKLRERADIDYALMIDVDDLLAYAPGFDAPRFKEKLSADAYSLWTRMGGHSYTRVQLIGNRKNFYFKGVLHEFLECEGGFTQEIAGGVTAAAIQDSARNRQTDKYARDARTLVAALEMESDPFMRSRYTFYLAQSYRDSGDHARALENYLRRADQGFWDQEVYVSRIYAAQIAETLNYPSSVVLDLFSRAYDLCPTRAEALHGAARHCRVKSRFSSGYLFARQGVEIKRPDNGLFLAEWIYQYGMLDEFAVSAYWCGRHRESLQACQSLLNSPHLPDVDRSRVQANEQFARSAMSIASTASGLKNADDAGREGRLIEEPASAR